MTAVDNLWIVGRGHAIQPFSLQACQWGSIMSQHEIGRLLMIPPEVMMQLATLGLNADQARTVSEMLSAVERATKSETNSVVEEGREKARERWRRWKNKQGTNVSKRLPTAANASQQLARVEDSSSREEVSGGEEGRKASPSARPSRGYRIPDDFQPDIEAAVSEGVPRPEAERQARSFVDYWRAKPGKDGLKLDWQATWRVWYRRNIGPAKATSPPGQPTHPEQVNAALDRIINGSRHEAHTGTTIDASYERTDRGSAEVPLRLNAPSSRQ